MAHFYGTLNGSRGKATRCGTANSGLVTEAAGWGGCIRTTIRHEADGDHYEVELTPWKGSGGKAQLIAEGKLDSTSLTGEQLEERQRDRDSARAEVNVVESIDPLGEFAVNLYDHNDQSLGGAMLTRYQLVALRNSINAALAD